MTDPSKLIGPLFDSLIHSLEQLTPGQYGQPMEILHGASLGQHVRHILDMYQCLSRGVRTGVVNYEARDRDPRIETEPDAAIALMGRIRSELRDADLPLVLEGSYGTDADALLRVASTYHRELLYNSEHTVHHMALIRIGLDALGKQGTSEDFGVAPSTLKYRQACAQ